MTKYIAPLLVLIAAFWYFNGGFVSGETYENNLAAGKAFAAENGKKEGVVTTESGLQYKVLQQGTGDVHPKLDSKVTVHYHGTLIGGRVFDSSVERGKPATFGLNQVISGWTEGLQHMVVGEKTRFYIPANLAYGKRSTGIIEPGATLIFDVELLDIK